jgi:hypothetical protein
MGAGLVDFRGVIVLSHESNVRWLMWGSASSASSCDRVPKSNDSLHPTM